MSKIAVIYWSGTGNTEACLLYTSRISHALGVIS